MTSHDSELDRIRESYARRATSSHDIPWRVHLFNQHVRFERELMYARRLRDVETSLDRIKLVEIGAGDGDNLLFFHRLGIPWSGLVANELLPDRVERLRRNCPEALVLQGDARKLDTDDQFDVAFQSMVFSSILDEKFQEELAREMWRVIRPGGIVLWYDFTFDNPRNADVRGVRLSRVRRLFPAARRVVVHRVTLAPPIGRRVSRFYGLANVLLFALRTHVVVAIHK